MTAGHQATWHDSFDRFENREEEEGINLLICNYSMPFYYALVQYVAINYMVFSEHIWIWSNKQTSITGQG